VKTFELKQGTPEWHEFRAKYFKTASRAPVVTRVSKYQTFDKLLHEAATGEKEDLSHLEYVFDRGHRAEALARPIAEEIIGEELFPTSGLNEGRGWAASFDGLTMDEEINWEHKLWNRDIADYIIENGEPPPTHTPQMDHQMAVSGAHKTLFMVSDGTQANMVHCWYPRNEEAIAELEKAWTQFDEELEKYTPVEKAEKVEAAPIRGLPALAYSVEGTQITTNLELYKQLVDELVEQANLPMETEQEFADAEARTKVFKDAEAELTRLEASIVGDFTSLDKTIKDIQFIREGIRQSRLASEKQVKERKDQMRGDIIENGHKEIVGCAAQATSRTGIKIPHPSDAQLKAAAKGKRNLDAIQSAVNDEVARCKNAINDQANHVWGNVSWFTKEMDNQGLNEKHTQLLFGDLHQIAFESASAFIAIVSNRVFEFKAEAEKERKEAEEAAQIQPDLGADNPPPVPVEQPPGGGRVDSPMAVIEQAGTDKVTVDAHRDDPHRPVHNPEYQAGVIDGLRMAHGFLIENDYKEIFPVEKLIEEFIKGEAA